MIRGAFNVQMDSDLAEFPFEDLKIKIKIGVGANKGKFLDKDVYFYFNNRAYMKDIPSKFFSKFNLEYFSKRSSSKNLD